MCSQNLIGKPLPKHKRSISLKEANLQNYHPKSPILIRGYIITSQNLIGETSPEPKGSISVNETKP